MPRTAACSSATANTMAGVVSLGRSKLQAASYLPSSRLRVSASTCVVRNRNIQQNRLIGREAPSKDVNASNLEGALDEKGEKPLSEWAPAAQKKRMPDKTPSNGIRGYEKPGGCNVRIIIVADATLLVQVTRKPASQTQNSLVGVAATIDG